jgi:hypothetical protein
MGKGQTGLKSALGLVVAIGGFGVVGASPAVAATSAGCTAANAGAFNLSIPIGNALQFGGSVVQTFAAGDVLTATTTGVPTGTQAFLSPGSLSIVNAAFADVTGSATIPSAGTFTLTRTLSANVANGGTLTFTCVAGPAVVTGGGAPSADDQADTATNATTTAAIVEDRVVGGILDDVITTNPEPQGPSQADLEERRGLEQEYTKLEQEISDLERDLEEQRKDRKVLEDSMQREQRRINTRFAEEDRAEEEEGEGSTLSEIDAATSLFVPIDMGQGRWEAAQSSIAESKKLIESTDKEIRAIEDRIAEVKTQQEALAKRLGLTPAPTSEQPQASDEFDIDNLPSGNTSEGDSIFFAGQDPFTRALARYRGFRLDVADTGEGFSDSVKPLSFSRTLSSTVVGWVRAVYTDYVQDDASQQEGDNILVALGAHKDFNDELRIGLFATTTWGDVTSPVNALDIDSQGYSLGTYGRYKWGEIDLNASARVGLTDNDISVGGTTGSYDTRLASLTVGASGQEQLSDNVWMRPAVSVTGAWVNREDYQNSAGTNISGNTTWSGNVTAGPTIGTSLTPPSGFKRLEPAIGLQATYTFSDQDTQAGTVTASEDDYLSLSVSPQLSMEFNNGASLDVFSSYFGIGADLDGWSVGGTLSIPLN